MATIEEAVIELVRAQDEVRRLSKGIGQALGNSYDAQTANGGEYVEYLKLAYEIERDYDGCGRMDVSFANHDDDVEGYLAEHCQHSLRAHHLIQKRKEARKRLSIARRRITVMGKTLIKKQEEPYDN
ncbi:MAG: hypothetical protein WBF88_07270 [Pusillimonas sp.]